MSTDSITKKFKEPLPSLGGFIKHMWTNKDPVVFEVSEIINNNPEEIEGDEKEIVEEIKSDIAKVEQIVQKQESIESIDFNKLDISEIIERLRCKCQIYKDKYMKKKRRGIHSGSVSNQFDVRSSIFSKKVKSSKQIYDPSLDDDQHIECTEFLKVKDYAIYFIDNILEEATIKANETLFGIDLKDQSVCDEYEGEVEKEIEVSKSTTISEISNLLTGNFSPKLGKELILEIIFTWSLKKHWSYCIDFIQENSDSCADFYIYEVKWSLPTMSYPIPQITASVFFTIKVSRVETTHCPVTVSYTFETERYKFLPEDEIQHEIFLENIVTSKLETFTNFRI